MRHLLLLLLLYSAALSGQSRLVVTVYDQELAEGLVGANVVLYDKEDIFVTGASTGFDGIAKLPPVAAGTYTLEVLYTGFADQWVENLFLLPDTTLYLAFHLSESNYFVGCGGGRYDPPLIDASEMSSGQTIPADRLRPHAAYGTRNVRPSNTLYVAPTQPKNVLEQRLDYLTYRKRSRLRPLASSPRPWWARGVKVQLDRKRAILHLRTQRKLDTVTLLNLLGQPVLHQTGPIGRRHEIPLTGLTDNAYTLVLRRGKKEVRGRIVR